MRRRFWLATALCCTMLAAGLLLRRAPSGPPGAAARAGGRPPNVVVYLVDTLRADHLGLYGYGRPTSPVVDRWAAGGIVFEQAYAPSSWTRPSVVSLLSGLDPIRHGVEDRLDVIPGDIRLLSEQLRSSGYTTFAAVTNPNVLPEWGFDQGFDVFEDLDPHGHGARADAVSDWVLRRLPELAARQPFLLYLHLIDPHSPYDPPPPFDERFPRSPALPPSLSIGRYDGEIAFVDTEFGRMLDSFGQHGLADDTLVVFLSDHGEELMDHGNVGHGFTLFEEVVRVPLVMRLPHAAHAGTRIDARVSLIDVFPTILGLLGLPPAPDVDGRDLGPLLAGEARPSGLEARDLFLSLYTTGTRSNLVRGVVSGSYKYLRRSRPTASEELFELDRDPDETENRADTDGPARQRMAASLDAHLAQRTSGVHLRVVSSPMSEALDCEVVLQTTGRFVDVEAVRLEPEDRVALDDDARMLALRSRLVNRTHGSIDGDRLVADEDGLVFRIEPPDAPIVVQRLGLDDGGRMALRTGSLRALQSVPMTFETARPDAAVRDMGELLRDAPAMRTDAEAYLAVVRPPATHDALSDPMRDRLEALGYLEPDD